MAIHTFVAGEAFTAAQANFLNVGADSGTYAPTLTGMAVGTGGSPANTASFTFIGGELCVEGRVQFGTTGQTFPTAPTVSLPSGYTIATTTVGRPCGMVNLGDAGTGTFAGRCQVASSTTVGFVAENTASTHNIVVALSTTVPFTWASNDTLEYSYRLRATSP